MSHLANEKMPTSPPARPERPPSRLRAWLLNVIGIYPVLLLLVTLIGDALPDWAVPLRLLVIVPIAVAAMIWVVGPVQRRLLSWNRRR